VHDEFDMVDEELLTSFDYSVYPLSYSYSDTFADTINGSSKIGLCSISAAGNVVCLHPNSSILTDGITPNLTELDGDRWAGQLLTLKVDTTNKPPSINFPLDIPQKGTVVNTVEVVLFNCPQWGIGVSRISIQGYHIFKPVLFAANVIDPALSSCGSLVRVCMPLNTTFALFYLTFEPVFGSNWIHLADVKFHTNVSTCPPDRILNPKPYTPPSTSPSISAATTAAAGQSLFCINCVNS
jgi:hypothetical protein